MTKKIILGLALTLILILPTATLSAHAVLVPDEPPVGEQFNLYGAGSSFVFPLMDKWRVTYHGLYPSVTLNYASVGSGAGINLMTKKTVDFGATDAPLQHSDQKAAPGALTFPESLGAVAICYNLYYTGSGLKFNGTILTDIYDGKITHWNDPMIQALNPSVSLPNAIITPIHRADASGTTYAFTDYLSHVDKFWKNNYGVGKSIPWKLGPGIPNNGGVARTIIYTPFSIGYVELAYAIQNKMTYGAILNGDGTGYVLPSAAGAAAAAAGASLPESNGDWSKVSIVNQPGANTYPISTFTYIVLYGGLDKIKTMSQDKATTLIHFIYWIVTEGQNYAPKLMYPTLPSSVQEIDKRGLAMITYKGTQLFAYDGSTAPSNTATTTTSSTGSSTSSGSSSSTSSSSYGGFDWNAWAKKWLK